MPWATVNVGDAVQSAALLLPYFRARHERDRLRANSATATGFSSTPALGDSIQRVNAEASIWRVQRNMPTSGKWVTTQKWDGASYSAIAASAWDNEAAIQTWKFDGVTRPSPFGCVTADIGGFERKVAREIATLGAANYINTTGPIANGHKARCVDAGDGRVYERVAGAWVDAGDTAVPDQVALYGPPQAGDVLTRACFNETRAVLQVLFQIAKLIAWDDDGTDNEIMVGGGTFADWADAKADAETNFSGATATPNGAPPHQWSWGTFDGDYDGSLNTVRAKMSTILQMQTQFAKDVHFYFFTRATVIATASNTWDDNGLGFNQDKWNLLETQAGIAAATTTAMSAGWVGTMAQPNWCIDPAGTGDEGQGWECVLPGGVDPETGAATIIEVGVGFTDT